MRIAGAPISWGVCEVPGWGRQLPPGRVFREMRAAGLTATEFGPDGFLPSLQALRGYGLSAVGGFVPLVLHEGSPTVDFGRFRESGATVVVLAAATGRNGYDSRPCLDANAWQTLLGNVDRISDEAAAYGLTAVLHPHVGTMVEGPVEVRRVLDGSGIPLCLDTGHLAIGGSDPAELARAAGDRIAHVHAKDVDAALAARVRDGDLTFTEAVGKGLFRPLGDGDLDFPGIVAALSRHGYAGWWVLEQDTILTGPADDAVPAADVRRSLAHLRAITAR